MGKQVIKYTPLSYGTYAITIKRYGKLITETTHNMTAIDRLNADVPNRACYGGYTYRQAEQTLYDEVVRKHKQPTEVTR